MDVQGYLSEVRALYASGQTTEHSFRPALAKLFASIDPDLTAINEPKHITEVGAPNLVFQRGGVAIGWCEAKDIRHYQKIIKILTETDRIMREIELPLDGEAKAE